MIKFHKDTNYLRHPSCVPHILTPATLEQKVEQWANHEFGEDLFAPDGADEYDAIMANISQNQLLLVGPEKKTKGVILSSKTMNGVFCSLDP